MPASPDVIAALQGEMERALERGDQDWADALRDRLAALSDGGSSYLRAQLPGAMGLGTSQERPLRPKGWKPPPKPDMMTSGGRKAR